MKIVCIECSKEFKGRKENKYCSRGCFNIHRKTSLKSVNNPNWKDKLATYGQKHRWIRQNYGKATRCEDCDSTTMVEWSNNDHKYSRDIGDYRQLCKQCHAKHDTEMFGWAVRRNA